MDWGLFILRFAMGAFFFGAGFRKAFHPAVRVAWPALRRSLGLPQVFDWLMPVTQMLGGTALILGFLTPLAALGLGLQMAGAIRLVCWGRLCQAYPVVKDSGRWVNLLMEPECNMLVILLALVFTGAGAYSLDALLWR